MENFIVDPNQREQKQRWTEEILQDYRDFVLRNARGNLLDEDEKDQELKKTAQEITKIFFD